MLLHLKKRNVYIVLNLIIRFLKSSYAVKKRKKERHCDVNNFSLSKSSCLIKLFDPIKMRTSLCHFLKGHTIIYIMANTQVQSYIKTHTRHNISKRTHEYIH